MFLVTGATGGLGRRVVKLLRQQQQEVRAFVRLSARYDDLEREGAEIFIGDLRQSRDITRAIGQVKYVISTHGGTDAQAIDYRANVDLIDCAKANGVKHFVFISVLGVDRPLEDTQEEAPTFKAKRAIEKYLQASGLNYTILRPSGFAHNFLSLAENFRQTGIYLLIGNSQNRASIVSTDDLARLAIASCTTEGAKNQILPVGGPDILKREDIPRIFGRIFNREPIMINPPLILFDGLRLGLKWVNPQINNALATLRTLLAGEFFCTAEEIARLETLFGFKMESLESFLRRYLES